MRWRSVMTAVCYDELNRVLFDKTVPSTFLFIVSPVSLSTKAVWWYVACCCCEVSGALLWNDPLICQAQEPRQRQGSRITLCTVVMLNLWNVSQARGWVSTSSALLRPETVWHNTPRAVSTWQHGRSERGRGREGRTNLEWALTEMLFHVEVFMNERKVSLALCFSRRTLFGVDMFDFS